MNSLSPSKEDYLKIIYELGGIDREITNKEIGNSLEVSAPSVSEMIRKLLKSGYIKHFPYKGIQLTEKGAKEASILVRKHRLWEVFLVEKLNFQWNDVHQEAEVLEHATSDELANRLEAFLNYPKHCPHGGAIPEEKGAFPEQHHQNLTEFVVGDVVNIKRVLDEKELLDYLVSIGLEVGKEYCVVHYSDYQGPIFLKDNERSIQISYKAALNIFAEK